MTARRRPTSPAARPGYVLVVVLIVIVVLSLAAYQFVELMGAEFRAARRTADVAQARAAALSGLHYAAAVVADRNTLTTTFGNNPFDQPDLFADQVVRAYPDDPRQETRFSIVSVYSPSAGSYQTRYGVVDEGAKLNPNVLLQIDSTGTVLYNALMLLPNMTADVADAIVDWIDGDDDQRASGAESGYYQSLPAPYNCKNGPLNSLDEMLLVKGVTPQLLYGNDRNRNGLADDTADGSQDLDRGWSEYLTVYGRELNVDTTGAVRLYVNQTEDLPTFFGNLKTAVGDDMATYIMGYRLMATVGSTAATSTATSTTGTTVTVTVGAATPASAAPAGTLADLAGAIDTSLGNGGTSKRQITNLLSLVNTRITLPKAADAPPNAPTQYVECPLNDPAQFNALLPTLLDKLSTKKDVELVPRLNITTAPAGVLLTLPGLAQTDVDALISAREGIDPSSPAAATGAWAVTSGAVSQTVFTALQPFVTGTSMVYRVQAIGYFGQGGPVARVEGVVDTNMGNPRFLMVRDLTDLDSPRGFEPPRK